MLRNVLYVEDNPFSVQLMELFFRRQANYCLLVATDGQSGWEQALLYKPDVVLMDINLPDMTGWDLTRKLRDNPATKKLPIIAITSLSLERYQELSLEAGVNLYLRKTTNHKVLLQRIEELLSSFQI